MHHGPRPFRATKTCGRCGTIFPTRYEWKHHTPAACDTARELSVTRELSREADRLISEAMGRAFAGGRGLIGLVDLISPHVFRERLTIDGLARAKERLGPPITQFQFRPLAQSWLPPNTVLIIGNPESLKGFGLVTNIGKEPTHDGTDATTDRPGKEAPPGTDAAGTGGAGTPDPAAG